MDPPGLHPPIYSGNSSELLDFISELETYFVATGKCIQGNSLQCEAILRHTGGTAIRKAVEVNKANIPQTENETLYAWSKRIVMEVILPTVNKTHESYIFRHMKQQEGEDFQVFHNRLVVFFLLKFFKLLSIYIYNNHFIKYSAWSK